MAFSTVRAFLGRRLRPAIWSVLAVAAGLAGGLMLALGSPRATEGVPPTSTPSASPPPHAEQPTGGIEFRTDGDSDDASTELLAAGSSTVIATLRVPPGRPLEELQAVARWQGQEAGSPRVTRLEGEAGKCEVILIAGDLGAGEVFGAGVGELKVLRRGEAVAQGSFVIAEGGAAIAAQDIPAADRLAVRALATRRDAGADGTGGEAATEFRPSETVWVAFEYVNAPEGGQFAVAWRYHGELLRGEVTRVAANGSSGRGVAWLSPKAGQHLPPGPYGVDVMDAQMDRPLASTQFQVVE